MKYLGYGPSAVAGSGEIMVDSSLDAREIVDLWHFDQIIQGKNGLETSASPVAAYRFTQDNLNWLNAYNAPHWMQYRMGPETVLNYWVDKTDPNKSTENFGTSWVRDLMIAGQNAAQAQHIRQSPRRK